MKLILADDHQIVLDGLRFMLRDQSDLEVVGTAINTTDAMKCIEELKGERALMITDINMPDISGIGLTKWIKEHHPQIKVLILSMYHTQEVVNEVLTAEADGFVLKSDSRDVLIEAIRRIWADGTYFSSPLIQFLIASYRQDKKEAKEPVQLISNREMEVLQLIAQDLTSEEIANRMNISVKTVANHRQNMLDKCGCRSTVGLLKLAVKNRWIDFE